MHKRPAYSIIIMMAKVHLLLIGLAAIVLVVGLELMIWKNYPPSVRVKIYRYHFYAFIEFGIIFMSQHIWRRINKLLINTSWLVRTIAQLLSIVFLGLATINFLIMDLSISHEPSTLVLICSFMLGITLFIFIAMVTIDISGFVLRRLFFTKLSSDSKRREEIVRTLFSLFCGILLSFFGLVGVNNLQIEPVTIPIKALHPSLNGTTIAQLSDIHLGPFIGRSRLKRIVDITNSLGADIVVITGDLADSPLDVMKKGVEPLKDLKTKYGTYFCTGNHDYYTGDVDNWIQHLPSINVKPLINERVCLLAQNVETCENGLYIAGLEDIETRRLQYGSHSIDIHRALSGRTKNIPTIVLAHQPKAAAEAIEWSGVNLVLSGHTHAGQVFPIMIAVYLYNPFFVGLYQPYEGVFVYVSPGVNYFTLPLRHYRPGITYITLTMKA